VLSESPRAADADPDALARIRKRLVTPMPSDRVLGWVLPLLITLGAGILRFWHLTRPSGKTLHSGKGLVFDEVYYAHDSWGLLTHGVETNASNTGPGFVVHPPLGKWMIAFGEWLLDHGKTVVVKGTVYPASTLSFRISAAIIGTLSILLIARIARRLFRSTVMGCVAGLLLSFDGLVFVQSRTSLLDIFLMFWVLAAFGALLIDRDRTRKRLADRLTAPLQDGEHAPWLGWRPWRWVAGLCIGCSMSVKWSGGYYLIAWLVLAAAWDIQAHRECYVGARGHVGRAAPYRYALLRDTSFSLVPLVALPAVVYVASWTGWFLAGPEYAFNYNAYVRSGQSWLAHDWAVFHGWLDYQKQIWVFSKDLTSGHPYRSRPWGWLLMTRPIAYFYNGDYKPSACGASSCSQEVLAIDNPAIWWPSIAALIACVWQWLGRRDWRGLAIVLPFLAGYLPWAYLDIHAVPGSGGLHRTMFFYYMVPEVPFMVLAVTFGVGLILGKRAAERARPMSSARRTAGLVGAGSYLALVAAMFIYFYPVLAAKVIPYSAYRDRVWFFQCSNKVKTQENGPCWF